MNARRRQAPAFQLEVRAHFLWRLGGTLLWALALCASGAAVAAQAAEHFGPEAAAACGVLTLLLMPLVCRLAWRHGAGESWQLLWDGRCWALRSGQARTSAQTDAARQAVELQVSVDFGHFLLLCCRRVDGPRGSVLAFVPLSKRQHPGQWLALRWALFSARGLPPESG